MPRVWTLNDDATENIIETKVSGTGVASCVGMTQEQVDAALEREKNPRPFGFAIPPATKAKTRKRK